ncbi:MAG: RNA polymerase sigma factor [Actinomycetota bacterium]|nr:RNA polymerase sigma factor [Actinomycetota bacterium]
MQASEEHGSDRADVSRFESFFRANYPTAVRIAWSVVRDSQLAEDVAQDAMIAARRRFPEMSDPSATGAWLRVAAVHLALNSLRGERRRVLRQRRFVAPDAASAEEVVVEREDEDAIRRALARLPARSATVLVLRHSGLSYAEVADAMGVRVGHVGTMLRRAEAALTREVGRGTRS